MSEDASKDGNRAHFQLVSILSKLEHPRLDTKGPSICTINEGNQFIYFLPSAVLGEVNDIIVNCKGEVVVQEKRQRIDGSLQGMPMELRERELLPLERY